MRSHLLRFAGASATSIYFTMYTDSNCATCGTTGQFQLNTCIPTEGMSQQFSLSSNTVTQTIYTNNADCSGTGTMVTYTVGNCESLEGASVKYTTSPTTCGSGENAAEAHNTSVLAVFLAVGTAAAALRVW